MHFYSFSNILICFFSDLEEWRKVTEECKTEEHIDFSTRSTSLYTAKVIYAVFRNNPKEHVDNMAKNKG